MTDLHHQLQSRIRFLGRVLGDVIRDQDGQAVFDQIEDIRRASVGFHRQGGADAAAALAEAVLAAPGTIDVFAIGPLTNIALALRVPGVASAIRQLYIMGGQFATPAPEHNLRSDPEAAAEVFASGAAITVTGLEITTRIRLESEAVAVIAASGPLGAALDREIRLWWAYRGKEWNHPHDPVAVLTALRPELFEFRQGRVSISLVAGEAGRSTFEPDPSGSVSLTTDLDAAAVGGALLTMFTQVSTLSPDSFITQTTSKGSRYEAWPRRENPCCVTG